MGQLGETGRLQDRRCVIPPGLVRRTEGGRRMVVVVISGRKEGRGPVHGVQSFP